MKNKIEKSRKEHFICVWTINSFLSNWIFLKFLFGIGNAVMFYISHSKIFHFLVFYVCVSVLSFVFETLYVSFMIYCVVFLHWIMATSMYNLVFVFSTISLFYVISYSLFCQMGEKKTNNPQRTQIKNGQPWTYLTNRFHYYLCRFYGLILFYLHSFPVAHFLYHYLDLFCVLILSSMLVYTIYEQVSNFFAHTSVCEMF